MVFRGEEITVRRSALRCTGLYDYRSSEAIVVQTFHGQPFASTAKSVSVAASWFSLKLRAQRFSTVLGIIGERNLARKLAICQESERRLQSQVRESRFFLESLLKFKYSNSSNDRTLSVIILKLLIANSAAIFQTQRYRIFHNAIVATT